MATQGCLDADSPSSSICFYFQKVSARVLFAFVDSSVVYKRRAPHNAEGFDARAVRFERCDRQPAVFNARMITSSENSFRVQAHQAVW